MCSVTQPWKGFILLANAKLDRSTMMITAAILNTIIANVSITFVFTVFLSMPCYIIVPKLASGLSITAANANGRPRTSMCF